MDRAFKDVRTLETRSDQRGTTEPRRTGTQQLEGMHMPRRYGAGF